MLQLGNLNIFFALAIFIMIVLIFVWLDNTRIRRSLRVKESEMQRRMYEVTVLKELGDRIGYSLNVQKIVDVITGSLRKLLDYSTVSYLLVGDEGRIIFHCLLEESVNKKFIDEVESRMITALSALIGREIKLTDIDESISGSVTEESNEALIRSAFNIPVVINNHPVGLLNVASTKPGLYREEEMNILYTIMNQASTAVSKLENILEQEKGKLNSMVQSMADGVLMIDTKNRLLVINPTAKTMLGIEKTSPTIVDVWSRLSSKFDLRTKIDDSLKHDKLIIEERLKIDSKVLRVLISPVKDSVGGALGAVVLFHDITKEEAIEKMREDFTSMMVHELRSPLTGIRSIANLLKEDSVKNEQKKYKEFINLITTNSTSMLDLVNDLLDVAKLESGKFQILKRDTNIQDLIKMRIQSFASLASENHLVLESNVAPDLPVVQIDENKIGQVLNNLISNAIKFTEQGKIVVSATIVKKGGKLDAAWPGYQDIKIDNDYLLLAVTDTGIGIPADQISKLFNKFTQLEATASSEKKGTGLGLVISKGIIEAHGGKIGVFSQPGMGATFYCLIPLLTEMQANAQQQR